MKRPAFLIAALIVLPALPACDNSSQDVEVLPRSADDEAPDGLADHHHGRHGRHHGEHHRGMLVERLCQTVDCTPEQQQQLEALKPDWGSKGDHEAHRGDREADFAALADIVRADTLDTDALAQFEASFKSKHDQMRSKVIDALVAAHGILTAEQRAKAADQIQTLLPMMGGKHGDGDHERDPAKFATRRAEHLCEKIGCTDDVAKIAAVFEAARPKSDPDAMTKVGEAAAAALRADSFDATQAEALLDQLEASGPRHHGDLATVLPQLHAALTTEQRAALADLIEHEGPRALLGGRHGRHGGKHKRGRHGRHDQGDDEQLAG